MAAGLDLHILVVLGADLTQLESGAHLTVQLILFLAGETNETGMSSQAGKTLLHHIALPDIQGNTIIPGKA